jgi:DNA-binding NarL/FixJ family response regulator
LVVMALTVAPRRAIKRVLLIAANTLFGRGVESLLRHEPGLEFLGCETDVSRSAERVQTAKPDVVIIVNESTTSDLGATLRNSLEACGHIRVIELNPDNNAISVYSGQRQIIRQVGDLVEAIVGPSAG